MKLPLDSNQTIMSRKNILSFLTAVCATLTISSCFVNEKAEPDLKDNTIRYNLAPVKEEIQTKALVSFPTSSTFGSYAFKIPAGKNYDNNSAEGTVYINNAEIGYDNETGYWKCDSQTYSWPNDGGSLTFFSYSPYGLAGVNCSCVNGITIDNYTVGTTLGDISSDILVADVAKDLTQNQYAFGNKGVPTLFKHKLSRVRIVASLNNKTEAGEYAYIKSLTLNNIYRRGDYINGAWTNHDMEYDFPDMITTQIDLEYGTQSIIMPLTVMMPQPMTSTGAHVPSITIVYRTHNHGADQTQTIPLYNGPTTAAAWETGKEITYYINISTKDEYIEFNGSTSTWIEETGGDINLGN